MDRQHHPEPCQRQSCDCAGQLPRREFLKLAGITAAGTTLAGLKGMPLMAGPFEDENEYLSIIPQDKRLAPDWVRSLYQRGQKETYADPEALKHIGMPVGGLFAGTVYLGGDGRLWLWDVFNRDQEGIAPRTVQYKGEELRTRNGANYVDPAEPFSPMQQGFALSIGEAAYKLDHTGFSRITFDGRYPIGRVAYRDDRCPLTVQLEAFSPFIPLNVDDSSLPAVVTSYTIKNASGEPVECQLRGWLENPVALYHRESISGKRVNRIVRGRGLTMLTCSAVEASEQPKPPREDIVFADFESQKYEGWTAEGEAFGDGPIEMKNIPAYQGDVGGKGKCVVNSHASAPGGNVREKDAKTGTLTSEPFTIQRNYINFLIGGGNHPGKTCLNLIVDGKVVASASGSNHNQMMPRSFRTANWQGKTAKLEIVDQAQAGWGNIGVDHIVFSDRPAGLDAEAKLSELHDYGTMVLGLLADSDDVTASAAGDDTGSFEEPMDEATSPLDESLIGTLGRKLSLGPGESQTVTFLLAWHFPNFYSRGAAFPDRRFRKEGPQGPKVGHSYAARFQDAQAVARYVAGQFDRLAGLTRTWVETWYDSTLPYWLLDRTMASTSTLATTTCYRFMDGRFWAWEGIGCCPGTCTHVWHYAQAPGRLFPEIEREHRRRVDFGIALGEDGGIGMRAGLEQANTPAHDGQCGRILGVLREHQMSTDDAFLKELWPKVKKAIEFMLEQDGNADGMVEGAQPNTLDAAWFGRISFLASLYLAALRAGEAMATEMGDAQFAAKCKAVADRGAEMILQLFNGEYFIQVEDPQHMDQIGVGPGCHIDQVFGQTWAHWVALGRLFDRQKQLSALRALWRYNFVPDVGPFREHFQRGRWYATAGDAGLLMCTWPKGGQNPNFHKHWQYQYFNECMSGFEWQAASHMIWEGHDQPDILQNGLAVARAIHDRYNARLRNPYNEIECSDHYARAMASFGAYQAACGFECHGPKGHIGFAPRLSPDDFKAAFTAAGGWGTFSQNRRDDRHTAALQLKCGSLRIRSLALNLPDAFQPSELTVRLNDTKVPASFTTDGTRTLIKLDADVNLQAGQTLSVQVG